MFVKGWLKKATMRIKLNNIGKVINADVKIDGITVIAGENDTGKSTIGKTLFSIYHSFSHFELDFANEFYNRFIPKLKQLHKTKFRSYTVNIEKIASEIFDNRENLDVNLVAGILNKYSKKNPTYVSLTNEPLVPFEYFPDLIYKAYKESLDSKNDYCVERFNECIKNEFNSHINTFNYSRFRNDFGRILYKEESNLGIGEIYLEAENQNVKFEIFDEKLKTVSNTISLSSDVVYIDDPSLLDQAPVILKNTDYKITGFMHRNQLLNKLVKPGKIEDVNRFRRILNKINYICEGEPIYNSKIGFSYKPSDREPSYIMSNISTGLKSFIILKRLLQNGQLRDDDLIILDEPEVHLHPAWQILFAEIIVLLCKEYSLNILINTHSPYFLEGIEVYSRKYKIDDKCKYYLSELVYDNYSVIGSKIEDVTSEVDKIYEKLAMPFQILSDEEYSND